MMTGWRNMVLPTPGFTQDVLPGICMYSSHGPFNTRLTTGTDCASDYSLEQL